MGLVTCTNIHKHTHACTLTAQTYCTHILNYCHPVSKHSLTFLYNQHMRKSARGGCARALLRGNHKHKLSLCFVQSICLQTERCGQADGEVRVGRLRRPHGACLPCTYPLHSSPPVISLLVEPSPLQTSLPVLFALKGNDVQLWTKRPLCSRMWSRNSSVRFAELSGNYKTILQLLVVDWL